MIYDFETWILSRMIEFEPRVRELKLLYKCRIKKKYVIPFTRVIAAINFLVILFPKSMNRGSTAVLKKDQRCQAYA